MTGRMSLRAFLIFAEMRKKVKNTSHYLPSYFSYYFHLAPNRINKGIGYSNPTTPPHLQLPIQYLQMHLESYLERPSFASILFNRLKWCFLISPERDFSDSNGRNIAKRLCCFPTKITIRRSAFRKLKFKSFP